MDKSRYQAIVYRQAEGPWVAEVPGLSGCYAMMPTKEAALDELRRVFCAIAADDRPMTHSMTADDRG